MKNVIYPFLILSLTLTFVKGYSQPLKLEQIKANTFIIYCLNNSPMKELSWSNFPDSHNNASKLNCYNNPDTLKVISAHPIVQAQVNGKTYYSSQRLILLQNAVNFRDLGGYITKEGKQVKWGKIFRSADISKLSPMDLDVLIQLNLTLICDLRGEKEVEVAPDKIPNGVERIFLPAGSENISAIMGKNIGYLKNEKTTDSMILSIYTNISFYHDKYKPVFDRLLSLENDKSLLIHCTAGKDRTGIGAALILYALGVDEPLIYNDYQATNIYRKEENAKFLKAMISNGIPQSNAEKLINADPKYLKATFDTIKKQYGTVDIFLEQEMGLTADKRENFKKKYLY